MGLRVLSSNYCPTISWLHGAQMAALNMQVRRTAGPLAPSWAEDAQRLALRTSFPAQVLACSSPLRHLLPSSGPGMFLALCLGSCAGLEVEVRPGPGPPPWCRGGRAGVRAQPVAGARLLPGQRGLRVCAEARVLHAAQGRPQVGAPGPGAGDPHPGGLLARCQRRPGARLERKGSLRVQAAGRWGPGARLGDAGRSLSSNLEEPAEERAGPARTRDSSTRTRSGPCSSSSGSGPHSLPLTA